MEVKAHVLSKITSTLARHDIEAHALKIFDGFQLADSSYRSLAPIDILLGSDHVWAVFTGKKMFDREGNIIAISSIFGWVITAIKTGGSSTAATLHTTIDIDSSLKRFWELEEVTNKGYKEPDDEGVEQHFLDTHTRDTNGKYIVQLPFKTEHQQFADTLQGSLSRFKAVERRLQRDRNLQTQYLQFMRDYEDLGHMHVQGQEEMKVTALITQEDDTATPFEALIQRISSWTKLIRIVAYVLRYVHRIRPAKTSKLPSQTALTFDEIQAARIICLKHAQTCFKDDLQLILANKPLKNRSQLIKLAPMVCKDGLLRVGGRLGNSQLPPDVKHPILLPKSHRITRLILEHEHCTNLHPGVSALFVIVRQRYWILGVRNLIRKLVYDCIQCFRQRHHTAQQMMSDLPAVRITEALPFQHSGCDYAGPFLLKEHKARVVETYPGPDGLVRAVKLKTASGEMTRPITKLAVLPSSETLFQGGPGC
ncbi:hypothetical protein ACLKA6_015992 [Drosophila palustris]